jgi:hypothetical protein
VYLNRAKEVWFTIFWVFLQFWNRICEYKHGSYAEKVTGTMEFRLFQFTDLRWRDALRCTELIESKWRKGKINLSRYRPEQALGGSGRLRPRIFMTFGTMKVVGCQPYAPAVFTPRSILVLLFTGWVNPRAHGSVGTYRKNPQRRHWGSIPRPSD